MKRRQEQVDIANTYKVIGKLTRQSGILGLDDLTAVKYMRPEGILIRAINRLTCRLYAETLSHIPERPSMASTTWAEFVAFRDAIGILTKAAEEITLDLRRDLGDWKTK